MSKAREWTEESTRKDVSEANKVRKSLGLGLVKEKRRRCLKCDKVFVSFGASHRMCGCTKNDTYEEHTLC